MDRSDGKGNQEKLTPTIWLARAAKDATVASRTSSFGKGFIHIRRWIMPTSICGPTTGAGSARETLKDSLPSAKRHTREYVDAHLAAIASEKKPIVIEEFGFPRDGMEIAKGSPVAARDEYYDYVMEMVGNGEEKWPESISGVGAALPIPPTAAGSPEMNTPATLHRRTKALIPYSLPTPPRFL